MHFWYLKRQLRDQSALYSLETKFVIQNLVDLKSGRHVVYALVPIIAAGLALVGITKWGEIHTEITKIARDTVSAQAGIVIRDSIRVWGFATLQQQVQSVQQSLQDLRYQQVAWSNLKAKGKLVDKDFETLSARIAKRQRDLDSLQAAEKDYQFLMVRKNGK